MPYLYRHIRLDKNEPFYIGIGNDNTYRRAFEKSRRNKIWYDITSKSNYEVEILLCDLTWDNACKKEREFIKLYGRKDLGTGTLSNLTDGGEGALGRKYITSIETKAKLSKSHKGKKVSEEVKKRMSQTRKGKRFSEEHKLSLKQAAQKRDYITQGLNCADKIRQTMNVNPIKIFKNDIYIGEFINRKTCMNILNISKTRFYEILKSENKKYKDFKLEIK
jgi:hypothetical protein